MRRSRWALGVLSAVALTCGVRGATGQTASDLQELRDAPSLVLERSGVTTRLAETRSGAVGLTASLGLGFDRQRMSPAGAVAQSRATDLVRPSMSAGTGASVTIASPVSFAFGQPWPIPLEHSAQLSFDLPTTSRVRIESYDVRGREVQGALSE